MKKYLFGLGPMLVGGGLMFVLMHGEVSADDLNKVKCEKLNIYGHLGSASVISYCIAKCLAKIPERRFQSISSLTYYLDNHKNIDTISEKWEYFNKPNLLT